MRNFIESVEDCVFVENRKRELFMTKTVCDRLVLLHYINSKCSFWFNKIGEPEESFVF